MQKLPKNGQYMTGGDFEQWQDYLMNLVGVNNECQTSCGNYCGSNSCKFDSSIKVKNITFVVTEKCNLDCTYCYEVHKSGKKMSKEIGKQAVDFIFDKEKINGYYDLDDCPGVILEFIGGEPLLEIELMDYIVEYFKFKAFEINHPWATNYMINITSNGILFNTDKVQNFLKRNSGKVSIGITIDGNKELHDSCRIFPDGSGSYDIVEKSIKKWVEFIGDAQTKITLAPENVSFLNDALKNVWSLGIKGAFTNCIFEEGWETKHATILYNEMKKLSDYMIENELYTTNYCSLFDETIGMPLIDDKNWCGGNGQMLAIGTDGKCYPCIRFMKYSLSSPGIVEQSIGNIHSGIEINNIWLENLKKITMSSQSPEKCLNCQVATGCSLCTGYNYDKFGDPNVRATFICEMHQARTLACRYHFKNLYKKLNIKKEFNLNLSKELALRIIGEKEYNNLL